MTTILFPGWLRKDGRPQLFEQNGILDGGVHKKVHKLKWLLNPKVSQPFVRNFLFAFNKNYFYYKNFDFAGFRGRLIDFTLDLRGLLEFYCRFCSRSRHQRKRTRELAASFPVLSEARFTYERWNENEAASLMMISMPSSKRYDRVLLIREVIDGCVSSLFLKIVKS